MKNISIFTLVLLAFIGANSAMAEETLTTTTQPTAETAAEPATTAQPPKCEVATAGQVQCFQQTLCECKLFRTSLLKNDPGGYRWDCGIMRPKCFDDNKISDRENARPYNGPDSVYIDNRGE